ncbi:hypothetical protein ACLBW0_24625 [Enterobacteriaceae bacterium C34A]
MLIFDNKRFNAALLPEIARQIARLIGFPVTQALIERFGGVNFPVGRNLRSIGDRRLDMLRGVVGEEKSQILSRYFGDDGSFYIPRCAAALREYRNQCFLAEVDDLVHQSEPLRMALILLGPRYGIANARAWQLLSGRRTSPSDPVGQASLLRDLAASYPHHFSRASGVHNNLTPFMAFSFMTSHTSVRLTRHGSGGI